MNYLRLIPSFLKESFSLIDKLIPDKDLAAQLKNNLKSKAADFQSEVLDAQKSIIIAEAQGDGFLQKNWRPIVMLNFAGLVSCHWLGLTPDTLGEKEALALLDIVKVGLGGYVVGRSVEKSVKAWKS